MLRKTALVTGASKGGIGSALVEECQRQGFRVFATVRSLEKGSHLKHLENVSLVVLDVTQSESIARAVEAVKAETNGQLDVLINNSGGGFVAPLLDSSIEDGQNLFDVNVWGPCKSYYGSVAVRSFLRLHRAGVRSSGKSDHVL